MSMTIRYELQLLYASLTVGVCLMVVYDGLRLFRILVPHGSMWTGIEDAIYWAGSGITTFLLLFHQNDGILRWYAIWGVLFGMLAYNLTISQILLKLLKKAEKYLTIRAVRRTAKRADRRQRRQRLREERKAAEGDYAGKRKGKEKKERKLK